MQQQYSSNPLSNESTEKVRSGQRLVIFAIVGNILILGTRSVVPEFYFVGALGLAVLSIVGLLRLLTGLSYGVGAKIFYVILQFIPIANIISLIVLNSKATKTLEKAGYKVGFFGAPANQ